MHDEIEALREGRKFWYCQVDIDVLRDPDLTTTDKAIYAVLCSYMNVNDRSGRPSVGTIANASGCSKNTVRTALKNLTAKGVIEREERFYDGRQTSCVYTVVGTQSQGGSNIEGGRVQYLKREGSKSGRAELEPKELDLKDTLSEGADPSPDNTQVPILEEEDLKKIPSAMKETVEFLLLKTGRSGLSPDELGPIMSLDKIHVPARIQREITKAAERFKKQGKPLSALTFIYIFDSLKFQKSTKSARAQPKVETASTAENKAWEEANLAALEAEFGITKGGGNDAEL